MKHLKLTFSDIMQSKILYYDEEVEAACHDICNALRIDNMPAYDSIHNYERINKNFQRKEIQEFQKVDVNKSIFSVEVLEQFEINKHNVLFAFEHNILRGIVHFSDYNIDSVLMSVQDDLLSFEYNLRRLLYLNKFRNKDVIEYFKSKMERENNPKNKEHLQKRIDEYERKKSIMNTLGEFQIFYLSDLMIFAKSQKIVNFETDKYYDKKIYANKILNDLRNIAMHGKNPIELDSESNIYSMESLRYFFFSLGVLKQVSSSLLNAIYNNEDYKKSVKLDNINKLNIIHEHHPQALSYFLNR